MLDQSAYQFRNDDGTEATATAAAAPNTAISLRPDMVARCRVLLSSSGDEVNTTFQWQYQHTPSGGSPGGWNNITAASAVVQGAASQLTDGGSTTQQLGAGGDFAAGEQTEDGLCDTVAVTFSNGTESETELAFTIVAADVTDFDTVELRVIRVGGSLEAWTQTPTITVSTITVEAEPANSGTGATLPLTFPSIEGNVQVVFATHRAASMTPDIDGTGWSTPQLGVDFIETEITNTSARRAIVAWRRVVPAGASATVNAGWTTSADIVVFGVELAKSEGEWSLDGWNNNDNGTTAGTSLASNSVTPANAKAFAIDALVARHGQIREGNEDTYSDAFVVGPGDNTVSGNLANNLSGFSGYKIVDTAAAMSTTASWTTSALATSLIGVLSVSTGGTTGSLNQAQDDQTLSASGQIGLTGSLAETQDDQTLSATGTVGQDITGSVDVTQEDQTAAASGHITYTGSLAETQDDQTLTASGTVTGPATGSLDAIQDDQTATATGWAEATGTIDVTQDAQTLAASGHLTNTGNLEQTQQDQTVTAAGWAEATGTLAVTQDDQTMAAVLFVGERVTPAERILVVPAETRALAATDGRVLTVAAETRRLVVS